MEGRAGARSGGGRGARETATVREREGGGAKVRFNSSRSARAAVAAAAAAARRRPGGRRVDRDEDSSEEGSERDEEHSSTAMAPADGDVEDASHARRARGAAREGKDDDDDSGSKAGAGCHAPVCAQLRAVLASAALAAAGYAVGYGGSWVGAATHAARAGAAAAVASRGTAAGGGVWSGLYSAVLAAAGAAAPGAVIADTTPPWARPTAPEGGEYWVYLPPLAQWSGAAWPYAWPGTDLAAVAEGGAYSQAPGLAPCPDYHGSGLVRIAADAAVNSPQEVANAVPAVAAMPDALAARYTLGGRAARGEEYYNDVAWGKALARPIDYSLTDFKGMLDDARARRTRDYPATDDALHAMLARHRGLLDGAAVVVMGSVVPWYEAMAFAYGAREVLTVEYGPRACGYGDLHFATPAGVANCTLAFDVGFSISSFEHDGLGRYGDSLLPEADLLAMRAMKRLVRPGGHLLLSVPIGLDAVVFNAHRVYGRARWQLLTAGWEIVDYAGTSGVMWGLSAAAHMQPAWLLRNTPYPSASAPS